MEAIQFIPPDASAAQIAKLNEEFRRPQAEPAIQQEMAEANRPPVQVVTEETTRAISQPQWQHLKQLLLESRFQQLVSYEELGPMDGAYWVLEAHQADGYHMVFRHSPDKQEGFRKACEYLLDLSSARGEERY